MFVQLIILMLFTAILIHEGGHPLAALIVHVPVKEFVIGSPFPKWLTVKSGKIRISPLLIVAGVTIDEADYNAAPLWKKVVIALTGPLANFAVGVITCILFLGFSRGWYISSAATNASIASIGMLVTGALPLNSLVSPIGLIKVGADILAKNFWMGALLMWVILCFGIPAVNLLPIPALDGGQILMAFICHLKGNTPQAIRGAQLVTVSYFGVIVAGMVLLAIKDLLGLIR